MIEVPTLDTHQLREPVSLRRVDHADIVEVAIAWLQDIRFDGLDQGRRMTNRDDPDAPQPVRPAATGNARPRRIEVSELLEGEREAILVHGGQEYRLRIAANGKLILTK